MKSLGSHDLALQFTFHASALLVLGSEAPRVPPFLDLSVYCLMCHLHLEG